MWLNSSAVQLPVIDKYLLKNIINEQLKKKSFQHPLYLIWILFNIWTELKTTFVLVIKLKKLNLKKKKE